MRNYDRMRLMRTRQIGYDYDGRTDSGYRSRTDYGESRYNRPMRQERSGIEPGRAYPNRNEERMSMHRGRNGGYMSRQSPQEQGMPYEMAEDWVHQMTRSDGGRGPKWKYEDAERLMQEHKIECNPIEFWVAINAVYSDYGKVCKRHGVTADEFWVEMAEAFLCDEDAVEDKLMAYYECVVEQDF